MAEAIIRPFEDADLPGAATALVEIHRSDGYPVEGVDPPERWLRSESVLAAWVAEEDGRIVGHVALMQPHGEDTVALWGSTERGRQRGRPGSPLRPQGVKEAGRGRRSHEGSHALRPNARPTPCARRDDQRRRSDPPIRTHGLAQDLRGGPLLWETASRSTPCASSLPRRHPAPVTGFSTSFKHPAALMPSARAAQAAPTPDRNG